MKKITLIASTTFGLEAIVAKELKDLKMENVKSFNGRVEFDGGLKEICRSNIFLRCSDRVFLKMGEFEALSFEDLFQGIKKLPWYDVLPADARFPVSWISSVKSKLFSKSDCQAVCKKAIVEKLKEEYNKDIFPETGAEYGIKIQILNDIVTVSINTSGEPLNKRGYRSEANEAPIKETLAAAILKISHWRSNQILLDPTCGTGTLLIEAGMLAKNIAPGANRRFISESWDIIPEKLWLEARDEAYSSEKEDIELKLYGSDINENTLEIARKNIEKAGLEDCITLNKLNLKDLDFIAETGVIISNPPYGERLSDSHAVGELYFQMGQVFRNKFKKWNQFVITSNESFERKFRKRSDKNRKLYNGGLKTYLYQYFNKK